VGYLGINVADTEDEARGFLDQYGWEWPQLHDPERELARSLGASYQPHFLLYDSEGRFVAELPGGGTAADWEALLDRL